MPWCVITTTDPPQDAECSSIRDTLQAHVLMFSGQMQAPRRRYAMPMRQPLSAAVAFIMLLASTALTGADDTRRLSTLGRSLLGAVSSHGLPSGLTANPEPPDYTVMSTDHGNVSTDGLSHGSSSLARGSIGGISHAGDGTGEPAGSRGQHSSTSAVWPNGYSTAALQQPISFPEGWLAQQASSLLAFSLQALEQAAEEQVGIFNHATGWPGPSSAAHAARHPPRLCRQIHAGLRDSTARTRVQDL